MSVASYRQLRVAGASRSDVARLVREGNLLRVRTGWYASPGTPAQVIAAVRCGGSLTCEAALREHGIWTLGHQAHARVPPKARLHGRFLPIHRLPGDSHDGVDDPLTALRVAVRCLPFEQAVCAVDSALNLGIATRSRLALEFDTVRGAKALESADGRSESGLETLGRLRLRAAGLSTRIQVPIRGVGRVDLIVGDWLVLEFDGDSWHSSAEQREGDRRRDSALVARGYLVMRLGYSRVIDDWRAIELEVLAVVRRREHRWRPVHHVG